MRTKVFGYEKSKKKAKKIYRKIGRIPSLALNGEYVAFTEESSFFCFRPEDDKDCVTRIYDKIRIR